MNTPARQRELCTCLALAGSCLLCADACAATDSVWVHGFATQAALHTSANSWGGDTDDAVSTDYNEAGLNLMVEPLQHVRLSAQAVARNAGNYDRGDLHTDYAQIDYAAVHSATNNGGLRLGRVKNIYGLFNDTRDVAHTRPSIFLPAIIYWEQLRDIILFHDGGSVYWDHYDSSG